MLVSELETRLAMKIGVIDSLVLRRLIDEYNHCYTHKTLIKHQKDNKEYFLLPKEYFYEYYRITRSQLDAILRLFKSLGLIESRLIGNPAKTHFTLNTELINQFIFSLLNLTNSEIASTNKLRLFLDANTEIAQLNKLDSFSLSNSTNKIASTDNHRVCNVEQSQSLQPQTNTINTNNKNSSIVVDEFVKPTLEEVCLFCNNNGFNNLFAERFFRYYDNLNWHTKKGDKISNWENLLFSWFTEKERLENPYIKPEPKKEKKVIKYLNGLTEEQMNEIFILPNARNILMNEYNIDNYMDFSQLLDSLLPTNRINKREIWERYEPAN